MGDAMDMTAIAVLVVVSLAGVMRGITGFGGAMLMAPPLSFLIGPIAAVVTALSLESAAALVMFPDALPKINKSILAFLILPAFITVPIGGYFLVTLDPLLARKFIAAVVVVFSLGLLLGVRYSGRPRPATSLLLGSVVGVLLGATSVGAPPVILYLLSGPDPHAVTRANLTVFVTAISLAGFVMLVFVGAVTSKLVLSVFLLCIPYLGATWLGGKLFGRLSEIAVRRLALTFMLAMGIVSLAI
jgi:uncharacterized membrane protein YfcA